MEARGCEKAGDERKNAETEVTTKAKLEVKAKKDKEGKQTSNETAKEQGEPDGENRQQPSEIVDEVKEHENYNQSDNNEPADDGTRGDGKKRPAQHPHILAIKKTAAKPFTPWNRPSPQQ
jgi:hypothetical protein